MGERFLAFRPRIVNRDSLREAALSTFPTYVCLTRVYYKAKRKSTILVDSFAFSVPAYRAAGFDQCESTYGGSL
jgi:hypothetical protein